MDAPQPDTENKDSVLESQPGTEPVITPHDLLIDILGASFYITAGEDPAYLDEVLAKYKIAVANTRSISGMQDPLKVAILTGFLLCDEINKLKLQIEEEQANTDAQRADEAKELDLLTRKIIDRIDRFFEQAQPLP